MCEIVAIVEIMSQSGLRVCVCVPVFVLSDFLYLLDDGLVINEVFETSRDWNICKLAQSIQHT